MVTFMYEMELLNDQYFIYFCFTQGITYKRNAFEIHLLGIVCLRREQRVRQYLDYWKDCWQDATEAQTTKATFSDFA